MPSLVQSHTLPPKTQEMQASGIKPDQIAFGTAVSACAMGGQWQRARDLLSDMRRTNLSPDVVAYRCVCARLCVRLNGF